MSRKLDLDVFTQVADDFEKRQYYVLGSLKQVREEFQQNRLYPHLAELIQLSTNLQKILNGFDSVEKNGPKKLKSIDLKEKKVEFESVLPDQLDLTAVKEFITWAQPLITEAIEEGISIYEFVEENLNMDLVGIQPTYIDEGYFFLPNHDSGALQLFRYEMSIYVNADERFRSLKTTLIKTMNDGLMAQKSPGTIKLDLIREYRDLPNPATYAFHTPLEFSFSSTLFPVAKRKLLKSLVS